MSIGGEAVLVEEYMTMNGKYISEFIKNSLHQVLLDQAAANGKEKLLFVQDNDPSKTV